VQHPPPHRGLLARGCGRSRPHLVSNAARWQMMKGAIAMVCATQYTDDEAGGRAKKSAATAHFPMVAPRRVQEARTVRRFAPEFVDAVIAGYMVCATQYPEPEEVGRGEKGVVATHFPNRASVIDDRRNHASRGRPPAGAESYFGTKGQSPALCQFPARPGGARMARRHGTRETIQSARRALGGDGGGQSMPSCRWSAPLMVDSFRPRF
jgi:hypothetical protein